MLSIYKNNELFLVVGDIHWEISVIKSYPKKSKNIHLPREATDDENDEYLNYIEYRILKFNSEYYLYQYEYAYFRTQPILISTEKLIDKLILNIVENIYVFIVHDGYHFSIH